MSRSRFGGFMPPLFPLSLLLLILNWPFTAELTAAIPGPAPIETWGQSEGPAGGPFTPWTYESNQAGARLGGAVSTAGDVNGDGFSDLIVAAPLFNGGQAAEGRVFVFHGSATGLPASPDWTTEGNLASALYGAAVAAAGDVNGDGFGDVLIGAPGYANGQTSEGRVYLYLGSASGLGATPAWTFESDQAGAFLGWSVGTAGDVNGDGFADIIAGAPLFDNGQADEGRAFIFLGSPSGPASSPIWTTESNQASAQYGISAGTAGDVNGDGFADVIVGADRFDNGQGDEGRAFVYLGSASGPSGSAAWTAESDQNDAAFGRSVAGAGDVNGDGYADVIVGAPLYDNTFTNEGRTFAYHGSATGLSATAAWDMGPNQEGSQWGYSVATAGDYNGDGYADIIIGAPFFGNTMPRGGAFFVFAGSASGLRTFSILPLELDGQAGQFGCAVGTAGDVDGDGASDVVIGANLYANGQVDEGRVSVYMGQLSGLTLFAPSTIEGSAAGIEFGASVANAGDVNGDGFSDVLVGAPGFDNGQVDEGRAYLFLGSATGLATPAAWTAETNVANQRFGSAVASAGDVNGDGYSDVIIGTGSVGGAPERAFVYLGSPSGLAAAPAWTGSVAQAGAGFGSAVARAGDVNGDGFSDVLVGAPRFDNGQTDEGRVFLYTGSGSGLAATPVWTAESNQAGSLFGTAVAAAGDVNGDGFSDIAIGAPAFTNGQSAEGRAFVYLGAVDGPQANPAWTGESNQPNASYGGAVATAGDMNGDGFSDIAIGAENYVGGVPAEGRVYVHMGSGSGPVDPAQIVSGNMTNGHFGQALGTAGDVNQDGFSDLVVGADAYFYDEDPYGAVVIEGGPTGPDLLRWAVGPGRAASRFGEAVAAAGDVDGDGFSDVIVGEPGFDNAQVDQGKVYVYRNWNDGLALIARQARTDDSAPIAILGRSDSPSGFRLKALGRTPGGRGRVRMQYEVKLAGTPFDGTGIVTGAFSLTGAPGSLGSTVPLALLVGNLNPDEVYHWRLRIKTDSPFFPWSRWLWAPDNGLTEADLRTGATTGVEVAISSPPAATRLGAGIPNPFTAHTEFGYDLPGATSLDLSIYDVCGRKLVTLGRGAASAGHHVARWDGRDAEGRLLPHGVYFVRLELPGHSESRKVVIAR